MFHFLFFFSYEFADYAQLLQNMEYDINLQELQHEEIPIHLYVLFTRKRGCYQCHGLINGLTTVLTDQYLNTTFKQVLHQFANEPQIHSYYYQAFMLIFMPDCNGDKDFEVLVPEPPKLLASRLKLLLPSLYVIERLLKAFKQHLYGIIPIIEPKELLINSIRVLNVPEEHQGDLVTRDLAYLGMLLIIIKLTCIYACPCNKRDDTIEQYNKVGMSDNTFRDAIQLCLQQININNGANVGTIQFLLLVRAYNDYGYNQIVSNQLLTDLIIGVSRKMGLIHLTQHEQVRNLLKLINIPEVYQPFQVLQDYELVAKEPVVETRQPKYQAYLHLNLRLLALMSTIELSLTKEIVPLKVWKLISMMIEVVKTTFMNHYQENLEYWNLVGLEKLISIYTVLITVNNNILVYYINSKDGDDANKTSILNSVTKFNLQLIYGKIFLLPSLVTGQLTQITGCVINLNNYHHLLNAVLLFNYLAIQIWQPATDNSIFHVNDVIVQIFRFHHQYFTSWMYFQIHYRFSRMVKNNAALYEGRTQEHTCQDIDTACREYILRYYSGRPESLKSLYEFFQPTSPGKKS